MTTRIYLPSSGAAPVTPQTWNFANQINPLTFAGVLAKINSAMTSRLQATGTTSPTAKAMLRYVVGPLSAQNISGTVKLQMRAMESNAGANATHAIAVKIIKPDGSDRAVLLAQTAADLASSPYEFLTALTNRRAYNASEVQPIPLTAQDALAGDYLVIEIGFRSATTVSRNITLRYGDNSAYDMEDDTASVNDYAPYVDFSATLAWPEAKSGSAVVSGGGSVSASATKGARGAATVSGAGVIAVLGFAAFLGVAAISGGGAVQAAGVKNAMGAASVSGAGSVSAVGVKAALGSVVVSGGGTVTATGEKAEGEQYSGSAIVSGGGVVSAIGVKEARGPTAVSGGGAITASGTKAAFGAATISGGGSISATGHEGLIVAAIAEGMKQARGVISRAARGTIKQAARGGRRTN